MKKSGAFLVRYALEQIGVKYTFGIPGVHNTEIYDELNKSEQIQPTLVTHEGAGAFMADGVSRTSDSIGTLVIVPAAGTTHAMSGIGEAFLDGIPMLVISGGTRRDSGRHYQLHQLDQSKLVQAVVKKYYLITKHEEIIPTIFEAYNLAMSGEPGPVYIEVPVECQMFRGAINELPVYQGLPKPKAIDKRQIAKAIDLLKKAKKPGIYCGWGSTHATDLLIKIADKLRAPVSTTLQGLSAFPADHPLHVGMGFGASAVPAARKAFDGCDCMLAIGVRFSELGTGSFGVTVPEDLIHIDINPEVFSKNYPAKIAIEGDAEEALQAIWEAIETEDFANGRNLDQIANEIKTGKEKYFAEWTKGEKSDIVSPGYFFKSLRKQVPDDTILVVDDGKHTFLAAELFPVKKSRHFISPTDFNCMGFCVPASIGVKLANPDKTVVAVVGDGAFMMTGMELITAKSYGVGVVVFVFHDGELGQISQFQKIPLNRKTCTIIGDIKVEGVAIASGAHFISMDNDNQIDEVIEEALKVSKTGQPVLVDVKIDYTKKTFLTKGVVVTNIKRFPTAEKLRFIGRAIKRQILG